MFILGGCMLHLCVSGALYRPLHVHVIVTRNERRRKQKLEEQVKRLRHFCVNFASLVRLIASLCSPCSILSHFWIIVSLLHHQKQKTKEARVGRTVTFLRHLYFTSFLRHHKLNTEWRGSFLGKFSKKIQGKQKIKDRETKHKRTGSFLASHSICVTW